MPKAYDAVVVGAGPNGLAAAITLAQAGRSVLVREAHRTVGGGARSAELTLPGFVHDICSAIHPLSLISPFLRSLDLTKHGLEWVLPPAALAHPLDDGPAIVVERSVDLPPTLGPDRHVPPVDAALVNHWRRWPRPARPLPLPPRHPILLLFGLGAVWPAECWRVVFAAARQALFAGGRPTP
jgi:phytoene dehydrogenase-like protein